MLRKYSNSRTLKDNLRLGVLTAYSAGMVNIASLMIFFAFASNVTGHYAILAAEIARGNWYQVAIVFGWIFLFFLGCFTSNLVVIHFNHRNTYLAHAFPLVLEILCLLTVGIYGEYFYEETLTESEFLVALMLYAMGLQNGLTASISNSKVKTTHLTGATTDLGILYSMFTKKEFRENPEIRSKALLTTSIAIAYLSGGVSAGFVYLQIGFKMFYLVCFFLVIVIFYDFYKLRLVRYLNMSKIKLTNNRLSLSTRSKQKEEVEAPVS